jgi:hypothetical protein
MSIWILAAIAAQLFMFLAIVILWARQGRAPKDDPRLSRGLQLLQSKISVLEDLSERTEQQVTNLTRFLDERSKVLQTKILNAEELLVKIDHSMKKSLDVAEIFQDKIPHEEIIERNQTQKYVAAAKMANEGRSVDEISQTLDLPRSEVEFISKVNRDELAFEPSLLPEWAKPKTIETAFHNEAPDLSALQKVEDEFRQAVRQAEEFERLEAQRIQQNEDRTEAIKLAAKQVSQGIMNTAQDVLRSSGEILQRAQPIIRNVDIRKVEFPRIFK